jgi:anti-sigma-K factor RskA
MHDKELRKLLLETCPVRPGQESRAWASLKERLFAAEEPRSRWSWLFYPAWRGLAVAAVALVLIPIAGNFILDRFEPVSIATADSQSPGIYATSFYSRSARAQVVWLNGMDPATDKPTYLDPTTVVGGKSPRPVRDPNSL